MHWECAPNLPVDDSIEPTALRIRGLLAAIPSLALLLTAALLHPRQSGYGTHEQLMLPPCGFLAQTGWPCLTCGMTTSVAAAAHGQIGLAMRAQPFGVVLFLAAVALLAGGGWQAMTGTDVLRRMRLGLVWALVGMLGLLGGWIFKIVLGMASGQLPLH
jgi:hypothetical protein